ncbi:MAG: hydantoinase/oxoprolinase family protein, partial [Armatimonadetes bacterium]|nr:hydantoinase/oxoprolinase family protein [Armatimonadota bacterium]
MAERTYRLAFDIGGTFTDFVLLDTETGEFTVHKCLTTPHDPAEGALRGVSELLASTRAPGHHVSSAIHGTTLVTNAIIERKGAKVALLTTAGFRDVLEIRNEQRYDIYDLFLRFPEPLVPRYLRCVVEERVDRRGRVLHDVRREDVARALETIRAEDARDRTAAAATQPPAGVSSASGLTALAICFLHAYRNPANERAAARFAQELWPGLDVVASHEVASEVREYERANTAVANAYVLPLTRRYLETLARALADLGCRGGLYLMLSSGGICTLDTAARFPVRLIESGPAGGAIGAAFLGTAAGVRDLVSFDMGGTTAKICLIQDGYPAITRQMEVARVHRFKRGSGLPVQVPSVDVTEIGAGGGSVAWIDEMGLLRVGPRSAGADPGPACYGLGGVEPTVTDADLVLGYLDPAYFLGGTMRLDRAAAERAMEKVAQPLRLSLTEAAWGIHQLVNENMAAAARIHVIERGRDPRRYALLAFGGAGPVHACGVARLLGQKRVICPLAAGVLSAVGFLVAPASFELAHSRPELLQSTEWAEANRLLDDLEARGRAVLRDAGLTPEQIQIRRSAD